MAKLTVVPSDPSTTPTGTDTTVITPEVIAQFGAAIKTSHNYPGGDMALTLIVPFNQVMNAMPVMKFVGGVVFEVTVRRVPRDELPKGGW